jgi:hypothetical protein
MSDRDNVLPFSEGMRQRLAVRRAMGGESRRRPANATSCARHGCPHVAGEHADIRVGASPYAWGACHWCRCDEFLEVAVCEPAAPIITTTRTGMCYERCRCGAARAIAPGADPDRVAWSWPDDATAFIAETFEGLDGVDT